MKGRAWTEQDLASLRDFFEQNLHARTVARRLNHSEGAVRFKAHQLGLSWKDRSKRLALRP